MHVHLRGRDRTCIVMKHPLEKGKRPENFLEKQAMMFGKRGRPAEDRLARQREIYQAVSPLILQIGVQRLSMRAAAKLAYLSVGGLYYYFPTKRDLVLHGTQTETLVRFCQDFQAACEPLAASDPKAYLDAYLSHSVQLLLFIRPSWRAALELGLEAIRTGVEANLAGGLDQFVKTLSSVVPTITEPDLLVLARALRRVCLGALIDQSTLPEEIRNQINRLINSYTNGYLVEAEQREQAVAR